MRIYLMIVLFVAIAAAVSAQDFNRGLIAAKSPDFTTALKEWKPLAEQGHTEAQFYLGVLYNNGLGVFQDHKKAVKWYRLAAQVV